MSIDHEAALNRKFIEFMQLLTIYLNHFPRYEKYALSNRIRNTAYSIYDHITEGQKRYYKKTSLTALDIAHEQLRMQLHLANELGYFKYTNGGEENTETTARRRYLAISSRVDELGKMVGGWIKKIKDKEQWK